jgi:ATP-dependent DNA helicase RecQ
MSGIEDNDIHDFFRDSAFPSEDQVNDILRVLENNDGLSLRNIEEKLTYVTARLRKYLSC